MKITIDLKTDEVLFDGHRTNIYVSVEECQPREQAKVMLHSRKNITTYETFTVYGTENEKLLGSEFFSKINTKNKLEAFIQKPVKRHLSKCLLTLFN